MNQSSNELRSWFVWELGKVPELVIELVSNREGGELERKHRRYAQLHVSYYAVFDPARLLGDTELRVFALRGDLLLPCAVESSQVLFPELGLGLRVWEGSLEDTQGRWLRFTDGAARPGDDLRSPRAPAGSPAARRW